MLPAVVVWSPNLCQGIPHSAIFKMDNQQGPTCIAQGTLLYIL